MKFFLLDADDRNEQPHFLDWYEQINPMQYASWTFPRLNSLAVSLSEDADFMDIISYPYFMLSKEFANLVRMYDDTIQFKYAVAHDLKNKRHFIYSIPLIEVIDCLSPESELNRDSSVLRHVVLRRATVREHTLFKIGGVKNCYIVGSLEFLESAFRREVTGLRIREILLV